MPKMRGGRNTDVTSFRTVCNKEAAHLQLQGIRTLKSPTDSDDFVHVALSAIGDKEVIVKLQDSGPPLQRELDIQKLLSAHPNVITYICHFPCVFDSILWGKALEAPTSVCNREGTEYHMIIMEYINNDISTFLERDICTNEILLSIIRQIGLALLEFHINYGISHNDINRGNLLLQCETSRDILYKIGSLETTVNTCGYTCIYIDFQRGTLLHKEDPEIFLVLAIDEITLAYYLMSKWTTNAEHKAVLNRYMNSIMAANTLEEVWNCICTEG